MIKLHPPKHWTVALALGGILGLAVAGPMAAVAGAGFLLLLDWGLERSPTFASTLAAQARAMVGADADGAAVTAVVGIAPAARPNWCAIFVGGLVRRTAGILGVAPPIAGSAGALLTMAEFQQADPAVAVWIAADRLTGGLQIVRVGDVPVWKRAPPAGQAWEGEGHIGIAMAAAGDGTFTSVEGNNGPVIGAHPRDIHDPNFLGVGRFL